MKTISLFLLLIIATYNVSAQEVETPTVAKEGTYQFIYSTKKEFGFTTEQMDVMLKLIEQERLEDIDLTLYVSDYVSIYIPSKNKIKNESFSLFFEINK